MNDHHHNCNHDHAEKKTAHAHKHHHHEPKNYNNAFIIGISLNSIFVVIEGFYGYFSHSLALMADAGHNLSDVAALVIAWGAIWLATKKPTSHFTFGLRKSSILSALFNSLFLMAAVVLLFGRPFIDYGIQLQLTIK